MSAAAANQTLCTNNTCVSQSGTPGYPAGAFRMACSLTVQQYCAKFATAGLDSSQSVLLWCWGRIRNALSGGSRRHEVMNEAIGAGAWLPSAVFNPKRVGRCNIFY